MTVAVLKKLAKNRGKLDPDELIVVYVTGNGLRDYGSTGGAA